MKWGLKGGISIDTNFGPLGYVLWYCGSRSQDFFTFIQIGSGHTVRTDITTYTYTFNDLLICVLLSFAVKIGLFYIVYYTFLTGFFIGMLLIFYQTLDDKEPKWQNSNGIIGSNPGKTHLLLYLNI